MEVYNSLTEKEKEVKDLFFAVLNNYSSSNELIGAWLGRNPEEGGKVVIGWNTLNRLIWKCVAILKGLEEIPPEIKKILSHE